MKTRVVFFGWVQLHQTWR